MFFSLLIVVDIKTNLFPFILIISFRSQLFSKSSTSFNSLNFTTSENLGDLRVFPGAKF